jgi:hypothetical protein
VTGFALAFTDDPDRAIYISGDTVWYEGVAEVGRRFSVQIAILFMGAARVPEVGPWHLTLTAAEAVEVPGLSRRPASCRCTSRLEHFSESARDRAGVRNRRPGASLVADSGRYDQPHPFVALTPSAS